MCNLVINRKSVIKDKFKTDPVIGFAQYFDFDKNIFSGTFCIKYNKQSFDCFSIAPENNYNYYVIDFFFDVKKLK